MGVRALDHYLLIYHKVRYTYMDVKFLNNVSKYTAQGKCNMVSLHEEEEQ